MSNEFYAPYNFVPATGKVGKGPTPTKTWDNEHEIHNEAPQTRHDKWDSENKSGRIVCKVTLQTPTIVGADQAGGDDHTPATVTPYKVDDKPALPANSLRGMISSISEQISQSALRVLDNQLLSVRKPMAESILDFGILIVGENDQRRIQPLTISPLRSNKGGFSLSPDDNKQAPYLEIFKGFTWKEILPVYLDGYNKGRKIRGKFLDTKGLVTTDLSLKEPKYYWAKVLGPDQSIETTIAADTDALKIKGSYLLGQKIDPSFPDPITEEEYKAKFNGEKPIPGNKHGFIRGGLFILGIDGRESDMPDNKKHEYFIPIPDDNKKAKLLNLSLDVIQNFKDLALEATQRSQQASSRVVTPFFPQGKANYKLMHKSIVRYGFNSGTKEVTEVAWSAIWRKLADAKQAEFFEKISPNLVPWNMKRKHLTPAELIFGVVEDRTESTEQEEEHLARNLASRVRFSDGICDQYVKQDGEVTLKILSSPKLPAPSMYFTTGNDNRPISKTELTKQKHTPRGRKVYLHHQKEQMERKAWKTSTDEHANQKLSINPISKGTEFWFHIDFNNLTNDELSLLLTSLIPDRNFLHRLGLGKPLGLGSVKVETAGTFLIERKKRYQDILSLSETTARYQSYIKGELTAPSLPDHYQAESEALTKLSATDFHLSSKLIDEQTRAILTTVGDPNHLKSGVPVTYHLAQGQKEETEGFKWFVNNEEHEHQVLKPIAARQKMPTLLKNHPKPRKNHQR